MVIKSPVPFDADTLTTRPDRFSIFRDPTFGTWDVWNLTWDRMVSTHKTLTEAETALSRIEKQPMA